MKINKKSKRDVLGQRGWHDPAASFVLGQVILKLWCLYIGIRNGGC